MGLFDKKYCSVCGGKIGLLGNRKLEDGNLCKDCAGKLSPWFSDRRSSTVEEIKEQLAYREENRNAVDRFHPTRSFGGYTKVLVDEAAQKFVVTRSKNLHEANPDVIDIGQVMDVQIAVNESRSEEYKKDEEGKSVSYNPPRYSFSCNVKVTIMVSHPYFDKISFQLNDSTIELNEDNPLPAVRKPRLESNREYSETMATAEEIKNTLLGTRFAPEIPETPKTAQTCPWCGATTIPDASGCCEYCGGALG